jgi:MFS family permease
MILLGGNVLFGTGLFFHAFLYNFYLEALGHNEVVMGLAAAALTAGGLVALVPAGRLVDRFGAGRLLVGAVLSATVGLAAGALVERPVAIYMAAFVAGLGTVTWRIATGPMLMELARGPLRSRAFSWNVGLLVGSGAAWMALAGTTATWLIATGMRAAVAHRLVLVVGAGGTALAGWLFAQLDQDTATAPAVPRAGAPGPASPTPGAGDSPAAIRALPAILVWMLAPALVAPFFNIYFHRAHELSVERIGLAFGLAHAATAIVLLLNGEISARRSPHAALALWTFTFAPALWLLGGVSAIHWALLLYFVQGIASPAANPLIDEMLLAATPASQRGRVSSWRNATTEVAGIVGAAAGGLILRRLSFDALFASGAVVGLAGAAFLLVSLRPRTPGAHRDEPPTEHVEPLPP